MAPGESLEGERTGHDQADDDCADSPRTLSPRHPEHHEPEDPEREHAGKDAEPVLEQELAATERREGRERRPEHEREAAHHRLLGDEPVQVPVHEGLDRRAGRVVPDP